MQSQEPAPGAAETVAAWKRAAARAAVADVPDGAVLGLGSGTTAEAMLAALAERIGQGLRIVGVPTSERTRALAASLGIPLVELDTVAALDMSIDGADEVTLPGLDLVKGRGGALLREKIAAAASRFRVVIVDAGKVVAVLAERHPIPVEVERFGWRRTAERLAALGARPVRRGAATPGTAPGGAAGDPSADPFITDGGHFLLDCAFGPVARPAELAAQLKALTGVVDHGLFVGMTERVYSAGADGVRRYDRPR